MNTRDEILSWLKDAYAMERGVVQNLKGHASSADDFPSLKAGMEAHRAQSETHAERIRACIEQLGDDVSALKTAVANVMGFSTGIANAPAKDTIVKNVLSDIAAEHFEVACYRSLISAAEAAGETTVVAACQANLAEDQEMARTLEQELPAITRAYLAKAA
jgi:ferritin-like metal-binding protein YciE